MGYSSSMREEVEAWNDPWNDDHLVWILWALQRATAAAARKSPAATIELQTAPLSWELMRKGLELFAKGDEVNKAEIMFTILETSWRNRKCFLGPYFVPISICPRPWQSEPPNGKFIFGLFVWLNISSVEHSNLSHWLILYSRKLGVRASALILTSDPILEYMYTASNGEVIFESIDYFGQYLLPGHPVALPFAIW